MTFAFDCVAVLPFDELVYDNPKSDIFGNNMSSTNIFSGFKCRWIILFLGKYDIPEAIPKIIINFLVSSQPEIAMDCLSSLMQIQSI